MTLAPELESSLDEMAACTGKAKVELVHEAIGSFLECERRVRDAQKKIEHGYAQANRGELIDGGEARRQLRERRDARKRRRL